ncbi:MAG: GNAT family N-acetyltransferase [Planctomycetes bacterium]|nr:GNAT family N-acetyltransferase [Planctomycetota bacterium]
MATPTPIRPEETRALRRAVLRPHQPPEAMVYPGDDAPDTLHVGLDAAGEQQGVASLYREAPPGEDDPTAWRLRGMAVRPDAQGKGVGRALLGACVAHARARGGRRVWCNARASAAGFYARLGFQTVGAPFDLPGLGPHVVMALDLAL